MESNIAEMLETWDELLSGKKCRRKSLDFVIKLSQV